MDLLVLPHPLDGPCGSRADHHQNGEDDEDDPHCIERLLARVKAEEEGAEEGCPATAIVVKGIRVKGAEVKVVSVKGVEIGVEEAPHVLVGAWARR